MKFRLWITVLLIGVSASLVAQDEHSGHYHPHHKNEIGLANSPVYFVKEEVFSYGLHVHYIRTIRESKFGIGAGFERIFDTHKHNTVGIVGSYRPADKLSLSVSPGITFEDESETPNFAMHAEAAYEFEIKNIHIGPVIEFAYDPEDFHISLGLHLGFGF